MSRVILSERALESIIKEAVLKVEGVSKLPEKNAVKVEFTDSTICICLKITAIFRFNLIQLAKNIKEIVKLEVEHITPFRVNDITVEIEDVVYER